MSARPSALNIAFATTLSIPIAEARTPEPVYGTRSTSRSPWTHPSSPQRPWSALKATSIRCSRSRAARSSSTSTSVTSWPFETRASAHAFPVLSATSRSVDFPPYSTASRFPVHFGIVDSRRAGLARLQVLKLPDVFCKELAEEPHLGLEPDPERLLHPRSRKVEEREHVARGRAPEVRDEVRVDVGPRGVSDAVALQADRLDEPPGEVARRVAEGRAEGRAVGRLRAAAALPVRLHDALALRDVALAQRELDAGHHGAGRKPAG